MGVNFCFSPILHQHQQEKFLQQIDIHSTAMEATWQSDGSHRNQNMFKNWQNHHHGLHAIINCTADLHKVAVRQSLEPAGWSKCPCLKNTQFLLGNWPKNIGRIYVPAWPLVAKFTGKVALNHQAPLEWRWIIAWHLYSCIVLQFENCMKTWLCCVSTASHQRVWDEFDSFLLPDNTMMPSQKLVSDCCSPICLPAKVHRGCLGEHHQQNLGKGWGLDNFLQRIQQTPETMHVKVQIVKHKGGDYSNKKIGFSS